MNVLSIESSCDETAAAILSFDKKNPDASQKLLSNVVVSQIDIFKAYGGVIPEVAARSHLEAILPVIDQAFSDANLTWDDIDAIAVTNTPGLLGSLLIGTLTARALAILHQKPLYPIHHLKSHIYSNWLTKLPHAGASRTALQATRPSEAKQSGEVSLDEARRTDSVYPTFPLLSLVISGGHTQLIRMTSDNSFEIIGTTLDDAVGECFDKVAKILGLPYPGGPSVSKAALSGNREKYSLPTPNIKGLDFSFSGLKTAVLRAVQKELGVPISYPSHDLKKLLNKTQIADFAASFEKNTVEILLKKCEKALSLYPDTKSFVFAGGVSANSYLREKALSDQKLNLPIFFPNPKFTGDNAAMVAIAAAHEISSGKSPTSPYEVSILPRSSIN